MTEIALEPVRLLADRSMLNSVSLRTSSNGRKFTITIAKRFLEAETRFVWQVTEIATSGEPLPDGPDASLPIEKAFADPETAYWSAVDKLCALTRI